MNDKPNSYQPITPELAACSQLVTIKQSAVDEQACEGTLKTNAKARRLPAYQAHFGAPVMVLPSEVKEFLKSRPDIASKHHPKNAPAVLPAGVQPLVKATPSCCVFPFPEEENPSGTVGYFKVSTMLESLSHTTASERALVAKALLGMAHAINETLLADSTNQTPKLKQK